MNIGKVLVTGGAGFIGSFVVDELIEKGMDVIVLDSLEEQVYFEQEKDSSGWPIYLNKKCTKILGHVGNLTKLRKALKDITHIIHLAGIVGVGQSMVEVTRYTRGNVLETAILLEELRKHSIQRLVVASSISIYGEGAYLTPDQRLVYPKHRSIEQLQRHEWELYLNGELLTPTNTSENKPLNPESVYAVNKQDQEALCMVMGKSLDIPTIALRFFNTYGPRQALSNPYTGVGAIFASRLLNNKPPLIFEDGRARRSFIHVTDVAKAVVMATLSNLDQEILNVGTHTFVTIEEVARTLAQVMRKDIEPEITNHFRVGDIRHCYADIQLINSKLGYEPTVTFANGAEDLAEWVIRQTAPDMFSLNMSMLRNNNLVIG